MMTKQTFLTLFGSKKLVLTPNLKHVSCFLNAAIFFNINQSDSRIHYGSIINFDKFLNCLET